MLGPRKCQPLGFKISQWAHGMPLALALGVIVTAGPAPFSLPASWKGGPGFLWPSCCLREVHSQKSVVQEPRGCRNSGNISLEAGGARRARAQCAAGTGGWSPGWDAPPSSGDFQGRRMDCSWKSASVPLGAAPEEAAAPCPQRVPGAFVKAEAEGDFPGSPVVQMPHSQ